MRPITITEVLAAASANNIALTQTPLAAGNLTLNGALVAGGVATLDTARIVGITTNGNETGITFTITGTDANGNALVEAVAGVSSAVASSVNNFKTVTQIAVSAATAAAVTVGTTGVGASGWQPMDYVQSPFNVGFGCEVTGTANYTVQHTFDDVFDPTVYPVAINHASVAAQTSTQDGNYAFPVRAIRLKINSGSGTVVMKILQGLG